MEGQLQTWISLQIKESLWGPNPVRHSLGRPYKGSTLNPLRVQLNEITPAMCDTLWFFISFSLSLHLLKKKKAMGGGLRVTPLGIQPNMESVLYFSLFLSLPPSLPAGFFYFFPRLAERPLECSLWPSHWQMLLWNVMKFEMGAAVTIILGQGLSLAWYHYLWQLESAAREREREGEQEGERDGEIGWQAVIPQSYMSVWRQQTSGAFMEG